MLKNYKIQIEIFYKTLTLNTTQICFIYILH